MDVMPKSRGEKILLVLLIIGAIFGFVAVLYENMGFINSVFADPIVGDWECNINLLIGLGYRFNADGTYETHLVNVGNGTWDQDVFTRGTWAKIGSGYYKVYDDKGKIIGYFTIDNGWLYSGDYAYHKL